MLNRADVNQSLLSSIQSGEDLSSDDDIKTLDTSSGELADLDTTLSSPKYSSTDIQMVYNELLLIRTRLCEENDRLKKKAELLNQWEQRMRETILQGWQAHKDKVDGELNMYKEKLNVVTKDFKRTNESLQVLRDQNSELKRNLHETRENNEKLVEKNKQIEKRMENLIRLNQNFEQKIKELERTVEMLTKKPSTTEEVSKSSSSETAISCRNAVTGEPCYEHSSSTNQIGKLSEEKIPIEEMEEILIVLGKSNSTTPSIASTDSLIFLFNWLSDVAQSCITEWPPATPISSDTIEKYSKLLTILGDQSSFCLSRNHSGLTLSFLKLVYFSLITIECPTSSGQTRHLHSCSYRRLCDQISKCGKNQVRSKIISIDSR